MKEVVSVSIGSSTRDKEVVVNLLGQDITIRREGTDGDRVKAVNRFKELDGHVDAFGLGGFDLYLYAAGKRYTIREAKAVAKAAVKTPLVDGSGLKNSLERYAVNYLVDELGLELAGKKVLMTAAVDRFGMAEALHSVGADITFGDLVFGLGIPIPIRTWKTFELVAKILLPIVVQLPYDMIYPTGSEQEKESDPKYARYYEEAELIAGDFLLVRKYMPADMTGKWVLTNTTTEADVAELRKRGVELLVTTTPRLEGRSFGTNMMEATIVALKGADGPLSADEYLAAIHELGFVPDVQWLQKGETPAE
ncbi:MAG: quinate 5-dehydrogenase [Actinobacteria bacterium]|nr:MAG: quinate 5-dehydrogenase [Actinomycetota bacterium]